MKRYIYIKFGLLSLLIVGVGNLLSAQSNLSLDEAYALAKANYPLLKASDIFKEMEVLENDLVDQERKPTVMVKGDASLQSEALRIGQEGSPIDIELPIYRAQAYGEVVYNIYDGGVSDVRKQLNEVQTVLQMQQLEVKLYTLKEQVNKIFAGVDLGLQLRELFYLTEQDIEIRRSVVHAGVENGVMLESELTKLDVRLLQLENERLQIDANIRSAYTLLSVIVGRDIGMDTKLLLPDSLDSEVSIQVNRPELKLYAKQKEALKTQEEMIEVMDKPNVNLFGQAGLSYPNALNFTDVSLSPYALGGVKVSYKLFDKKDKYIKKQMLELQAGIIDVEEETFRHNLNVQSARYQDEYQLLLDQVDKYEEIADLQSQILKQLQVQLDNGVITSTEYILQSTEELRARQGVKILQSKLQQKRLEYLNIFGANN